MPAEVGLVGVTLRFTDLSQREVRIFSHLLLRLANAQRVDEPIEMNCKHIENMQGYFKGVISLTRENVIFTPMGDPYTVTYTLLETRADSGVVNVSALSNGVYVLKVMGENFKLVVLR